MTRASSLTSTVTPITYQISVKGKMRSTSALKIGDHVVVIAGRFLRVARIFDAYWLEAASLPDPRHVVGQLQVAGAPADLFTFTERVPQTEPRYDYQREWDNVAAVPISTHDHWLQKQISAASRRNVRTSEKKGVTVRVCEFDEEYIRGIMSISDESPIRAGRKYWHYGKD